jgi:cell division protein FtsN
VPPPTPAVTVQPSPPPTLPTQRSPAVTPFVASGAAGTGQAQPPTVATLASAAVAHPAGGFYVQTGSFSTMNNAERQRGLLASYGAPEISQASSGGRDVYRVRLGPYTTSDAAGIVADRLKRSGYGDARVVAD